VKSANACIHRYQYVEPGENQITPIYFERRESMFTPTSPHDDLETILPEWHEPFPEPKTIPSGWDLSEVLAGCASVSKDEADVVSTKE
jgi:hypothetical protein